MRRFPKLAVDLHLTGCVRVTSSREIGTWKIHLFNVTLSSSQLQRGRLCTRRYAYSLIYKKLAAEREKSVALWPVFDFPKTHSLLEAFGAPLCSLRRCLSSFRACTMHLLPELELKCTAAKWKGSKSNATAAHGHIKTSLKTCFCFLLLLHSDGGIRIWCKHHDSMDPS